jgi:hypothetical protein
LVNAGEVQMPAITGSSLTEIFIQLKMFYNFIGFITSDVNT